MPAANATENGFVAINFISCRPEYRERFEELFSTRAGAIDTMPGFIRMKVLRPDQADGDYLIVSEWKEEADFKAWMKSEAFEAGHKRGFADLKAARERGEPDPMSSDFRTYSVVTD